MLDCNELAERVLVIPESSILINYVSPDVDEKEFEKLCEKISLANYLGNMRELLK